MLLFLVLAEGNYTNPTEKMLKLPAKGTDHAGSLNLSKRRGSKHPLSISASFCLEIQRAWDPFQLTFGKKHDIKMSPDCDTVATKEENLCLSL